MGSVTLKGRIEYGSSLIAPDPQNKVYQVVRSNEYQLANPDLQPEVQRGTDMGLEVYFGNLWSLGVTYYNQMTQDLTTETDSTDGTNYYLQYQNVGRAHNTGVEFTGTLNPISSLSLQVVYGSARSFIQTLSPSYQGDYHAGDRVLGIPEWTGGATAVWTPWHGTTLNVAATHTARQFNVDYIGLFAAFDDGSYTGSERDYWKWYPSFTLVNTGITQRITANVSGYVQIANAGNSYAAQGVNIFSQRGRLSTVGLQWHF